MTRGRLIRLGLAGLAVLLLVAGLFAWSRRGPSVLPEATEVDLGGVAALSTKDCVTVTAAYLALLRAESPEQAATPRADLDVFEPPHAVRQALDFHTAQAGRRADTQTRDQRRRANDIVVAWEAAACPQVVPSPTTVATTIGG
jgi:hypothetical protein